jgi:hypothetical protein
MVIPGFDRDQCERAIGVGWRRQLSALMRSAKPLHDHNLWEGHIEGAGAELAGHIATGLPWTGEKVWDVPPPGVPDLSDGTTNVEVRWGKNGLLRVTEGQIHHDWWYMLVTGRMPSYVIEGVIKGSDIDAIAEREVWPERTALILRPDQLKRYER